MKKSKSGSDYAFQDSSPAIGYVVKSVSDLPKFHRAIWQEDFNKVSQMIKKSDINARDKELRTPLHLASAKLNDPILKLLCHYSPEVDAQDRDKKTALFKAAEAASSNAVNILLQARANPNISSRDGETPLHRSSQNNDDKSVKLLVGHGADLNTPNAKGLTPLHIAAQAGHANLVDLFAKEGTKLNVLCGESQTPLMVAAEHGRLQVVRSLLELRVETEVKNRQGWKAVDLAQINGHNHCKSLIEDEVKRRAPRQLPSLETQPGLFSDRSSFGVPAHNTASQPSDRSEESPGQGRGSFSEDDSISFEPSLQELERPKFSLSRALRPLSPPTDQTMSPKQQDLESDTDTSQSPPSFRELPIRISPLHSSPEEERRVAVSPLETPDTLLAPGASIEPTPVIVSAGGVQSSTPIPKPVLPIGDLDAEGSDTSVSEDNLYIPTFNPLSPLSDVPVPVPSQPRPLRDSTIHPKPDLLQDTLQGVESLERGYGKEVSEVGTSSPATPRHHVLATAAPEPTNEAGDAQAGVKGTELEDSSDFDSDQEVLPGNTKESGANPIYGILDSDSESLSQHSAEVTATSFEIETQRKVAVSPKVISADTPTPEPVRTLPAPDSDNSTPRHGATSPPEGQIQLGLEESSEAKPSSPLPLSDNTTLPFEFPEIQTPLPTVDSSFLPTVFKSISKFESLSRITGTESPLLRTESPQVLEKSQVSDIFERQPQVQHNFPDTYLDVQFPSAVIHSNPPVKPPDSAANPLEKDNNLSGTHATALETGVNSSDSDSTSLSTYANPSDSDVNPLRIAANPLGTGVNPTGTGANPSGTCVNSTGTGGNPSVTGANPSGTVANPLNSDVNSSDSDSTSSSTDANPSETETDLSGSSTNPVSTGTNPVDTSVNPLKTGANPIGTGANPLKTGANPIGTGANPLKTGANPIGTGVNPLKTGANPIGTGVNPLKTGANPIGTGANPIDTGVNPLETDANPSSKHAIPKRIIPGNPFGTGSPSHQLEFDSSLASEPGNPELGASREGTVSDVSSSEDVPLTSHAPTLWHTALSPNRSATHLPTQEIASRHESPTPIFLNTIPTVQLTDSKSLYTLTQQLSRVQTEKEGLEHKLRLADLSSAKMSHELESLRVSCSELQQERTRLVAVQQDTELSIRQLQLELQQKSSVSLEESEMLKQLSEKVARLEIQLVEETEAHTNEEVRKRELELQLQLSQTTGVQMSNRVNELCTQLSQSQNALGDLKQNYSQAASNYETLKKGYDTVVSQKEGLQCEVSRLESHATTSTVDIEKLRTELSLVSEELRRKESKMEDLQTSILQQSGEASNLLQGKADSLREVERRASEDKRGLEVQLVNANAENSKLQGELLRAEEKSSALEREVQSSNDKVRQSCAEMEQLKGSSSASERANQNASSVLQAEKEFLERENATFREQIRAAQARLDSLEQQLTDKNGELKHAESLLSERGNLVTILQRDVDHNALMLASTTDKLKSEEKGSASLSKQLEQVSAALDAAKQEMSLLRNQLEQSRFQLSEQKSLTEKLESRYQAEARQTQSLMTESRASAEEGRHGLLQELALQREKNSNLQEQLAESQEKSREFQEEAAASKREHALLVQAMGQEQQSCRELQGANARMQEERTNSVSEQASLQGSVSILQLEKATLCKDMESQQNLIQELTHKIEESAKEVSGIAQARECVESQLRVAESGTLELRTNYERQSQYIDSLKNELTAARRERTGNDAALFEMNDKKLRLEEELVNLREEKNHAQAEARECKLMWETEVKSRSKLGMKILQLEKDREESENLLKSERVESAQVAGSVSALESKILQLTEASSRAEEQNRTLGTELKSYKKRIKDFELREHRFPDMKAELSKEKITFENSLNLMRDQLSQSREVAASLKSDNTTLKAQLSNTARELNEVQALLTRLKSENSQEGKAYLQLTGEHQRMREELLKSQQDCGQKEKLYLRTKEAEMQNRRDFNHKLQELNSHILEQTQAQEQLDRSKREGEMLLIQELEKKTSQLESELILAKRSNLDQTWREEYNPQRYSSSYAYKDSKSREAMRYKDPMQDVHATYHVNDAFSRPQSSLLSGDPLGHSFIPPYEPASTQHYHAPSARPIRESKWLDTLDSKIADHLSVADSINVSSAEPTFLSRDNDPHFTAIYHNYEVK